MKFTLWPTYSLLEKRSPGEICGETIYAFLLSEEIAAVLLALVVIGTQIWILVEFGFADWDTNTAAPYCKNGTFDPPVCEAPKGRSVKVLILAVIVLLLHTCGDIFKGVQLMIMSMRRKDVDDQNQKSVFACGFAISALAFTTLVVACNFVWKSTDSVVSMVQDVFIIVFVLEVDEKALYMIEYWDPVFTEKVLVAVKVREETS